MVKRLKGGVYQHGVEVQDNSCGLNRAWALCCTFPSGLSSVLLTEICLSFWLFYLIKDLLISLIFILFGARLKPKISLSLFLVVFVVVLLYVLIFGFISLVNFLWCLCSFCASVFFPQSLLLSPALSTYTCSLLPFKNNPFVFISILSLNAFCCIKKEFSFSQCWVDDFKFCLTPTFQRVQFSPFSVMLSEL